MKTRVRRGFTLPEVLVTVTVVAVLAAVVVPAVTQYVSRGDRPATQQDVAQIQNAVNGYIADTRQFPGYLSSLAGTTGPSGYKGPYFSGQTSGGVTSTTATTNASFTSSGLGVIFADSIDHPTGYLSLFINTSTQCSKLISLDSLYDKGDGNAAGLVTWTNGSPVCSTANPTTGVHSAGKFKFMAVGQ